MKPVPALSVLVLAAATLAACATAAPKQMAAAKPDPREIRCREMLVIGSNTIQTVCGTEEEWDRYDRYLAYSAQALTQRMQGSPYSGGY